MAIQTGRPQGGNSGSEEGSVTPLVLGMLFCLLILSAGVTAAGSVFLGTQRLQHLCDGAAALAADRALASGMAENIVIDSAVEYLATRGPDVAVQVSIGRQQIELTCSADVTVTFGSLVGVPTVNRTVTARGEPEFGR